MGDYLDSLTSSRLAGYKTLAMMENGIYSQAVQLPKQVVSMQMWHRKCHQSANVDEEAVSWPGNQNRWDGDEYSFLGLYIGCTLSHFYCCCTAFPPKLCFVEVKKDGAWQQAKA